MRRVGALVAAALLVAGCTSAEGGHSDTGAVGGWVYQLSGYPGGGLDEIARSGKGTAVIDLARDGGTGYFTSEEIDALHREGMDVYSYFSMGTIETYRPEYSDVAATDMVLNQWGDWPDEYFVTYWDDRWWDLVMAPRLDQAMAAGFDGVYLDVPNAYEEIDLDLVPGEDRESLAQKMVDLVAAVDDYAGARDPGLAILPQNSPELREYPGYLDSIDGIGIEDLYFLDADMPCDEDWCGENLAHARAIADAGKLVLAVDYAEDPANIAAACDHYAAEEFIGCVTTVDLDGIKPSCRER